MKRVFLFMKPQNMIGGAVGTIQNFIILVEVQLFGGRFSFLINGENTVLNYHQK